MSERAHLLKTEQPRDFGYTQPAVIEVTNRKIAAQVLQYLSEVQPVILKPPSKRPLAQAQRASDVSRENSSMRKQ